ncbi:MAG: hypothetical protein GF417_04025 [Candidatus Latescibacteria bacterium]|nr:hypothetical protein [bacterium]MBD3423594.1 hypothetical protein [Candidatus Latescibacterota bacterium]
MRQNSSARNHKGIIAAAASALLLLSAFSLGGPAAETRISSGYDSFIDRYTVLENDTTESLNEYYLNMVNRYSGKISGVGANFRNSLKFGNQTVDERFRVSLDSGSPGSLQVGIETDFFLKHFREGSDYSFSNDYRQLNTGLKIGKRFSEKLRIRSRSRFELVDYDEHTDFDYDYHYIDTGIECDAGSILENGFRLAASLGTRQAPDTTELNYRRTILEGSAYLGGWDGAGIDLSVSADRRDYNGGSRPSSWLIISYSKISLIRGDKPGFSIIFDGESYMYDYTDQLYFDTHFIRGGMEFTIPAWKNSRFSFQPRYARLLCDQLEEERYSEYSLMASYDFMYGNGYWFSLSYEPGYRQYQLEDIYSNFTFSRVSLMGSVSVYRSFSVDLFLMHDPEKHTRRGDDFSITLISASLSASF